MRLWRTGAIGLLTLVISACTLTSQSNETPPTLYPLTDNVSTCGDVIREALAQTTCDQSSAALCYVLAEYNPAVPANNLIGSSSVASLAQITTLGSIDATARQLESGILWRAYTLRIPQNDDTITLLLNGEATLSGITPELDMLTLETAPEATCEDAPPPSLLVQARTQATLTVNGTNITAGTTAVIRAEAGGNMTITTLDGLSVVSASGVTRVVREGESLTVPLDGLVASGEPAPAVNARQQNLAALPIDQLPEEITLPSSSSAVNSLADCVPDPNWTGEHTVRRGESLFLIAPLYNLTFQELQAGNCVANPNRLQVGQVLRIPPQGVTATPPTTTITQPDDAAATEGPAPVIFPTATQNAGGVVFTVDAIDPISPGTCTYLSWDVPGTSRVFLNDESVQTRDGREVCPTVTTVYILRVTDTNGIEQRYTQAVLIEE